MPSSELHVAYDSNVPVGADMAFRADRLSAPAAAHWILCVDSDRPAVRLTAVAPAPAGYVLDSDGVLGLIFPAAVRSVRLDVAASEIGVSEWRFWVDDGHLGPHAQTLGDPHVG